MLGIGKGGFGEERREKKVGWICGYNSERESERAGGRRILTGAELAERTDEAADTLDSGYWRRGKKKET